MVINDQVGTYATYVAVQYRVRESSTLLLYLGLGRNLFPSLSWKYRGESTGAANSLAGLWGLFATKRRPVLSNHATPRIQDINVQTGCGHQMASLVLPRDKRATPPSYKETRASRYRTPRESRTCN